MPLGGEERKDGERREGKEEGGVGERRRGNKNMAVTSEWSQCIRHA